MKIKIFKNDSNLLVDLTFQKLFNFKGYQGLLGPDSLQISNNIIIWFLIDNYENVPE